jgi:hypothetical protein
MGFNNAAKALMLDALDETATGGITFIGVLQVGDPGTGTNFTGTEATGGSPAYARKSVVWGATSSGQKSNTGALTFDVAAGTYSHFILANASTGNTNNYLGAVPFGGATALKGVFSVDTNMANDQFNAAGHGLANGDRVQLYGGWSGALPTGTGLSAGALLYVVSAATDTFKLSLTSGGSAIDLTAAGSGEGYWQKVVPEVFAAQGQITAAIGALVLDATAF